MTPDTAAVSVSVANDSEVMASVDDDGKTERLVIADVSREDAWICMRVTDTASLPDWQ
ncbi:MULTISPECIES: hypothetical protein [unclassified Haladaptatus]|uniref:DUF7556 family protein n=1 Tax=unclassified Haladaptatus TaxID=2622732 RepID=UPI00209C3FE9|nr:MULTISPECIES: hypothetical protein [unclassified Haladaptatus]MCO8242654.1 hypothetical protein [Haladaptatus sp. AB643]MCO8252413.1 hypothetical protein [Haladaptatus sp. AB618]